MITYTKMRDGSWGLRGPANEMPAPGATVAVRKRDGSTKIETVSRIVWTGKDRDGAEVALATIGNERLRAGQWVEPRRRSAGARYECEECGDFVEPGTRCWETGCVH